MGLFPLPAVSSSRQRKGKCHFPHRKTRSVWFDVTKNAINSILHKLCKMFGGCTTNLCAVRKSHIIPRVWLILHFGQVIQGSLWSCLKCVSHPWIWHGEPAPLGVSPRHVHFQQASYRIFMCIQVEGCGFMEEGIGTVNLWRSMFYLKRVQYTISCQTTLISFENQEEKAWGVMSEKGTMTWEISTLS